MSSQSSKYTEVQTLLQLLHNQYARALENDDLCGIVETSRNLCSVYASLGSLALASKWANEHLVSLCKQYVNRELSSSQKPQNESI